MNQYIFKQKLNLYRDTRGLYIKTDFMTYSYFNDQHYIMCSNNISI